MGRFAEAMLQAVKNREQISQLASVTERQIQRFRDGLVELEAAERPPEVDPVFWNAQAAAMRSVIADLEADLELLKARSVVQ